MAAIILARQRGVTWVAEITGRDNTYGLARTFIPAASQNDCEAVYLLDEGKLYQYQAVAVRLFFTVKEGLYFPVPDHEAWTWIDKMHAANTKGIDALIDRVNEDEEVKFDSEGGFSMEPSDN